jgi:primosomal protein N' (replication factor Y)
VKPKFAEIVFPLPFEKSFHYKIPDELSDLAQIGVRAVAPFGKRILTGFIINITEKFEIDVKELKSIEDIIDSKPIFDDKLFKFSRWIADYYFASLGEVLKAAVPYGSEVESKKTVVVDIDPIIEEFNITEKKESNYSKLLQILSLKNEFSISELKKKYKAAGGKNLNYNLNKIEEKGLCTIFVEKKKPKVAAKIENLIELKKMSVEEFSSILSTIEKRAPKQVDVLVALYTSKEKSMFQKELIEKTQASAQIIKALFKKKLINVKQVEIKREYIETYKEEKKDLILTEEQQNAFSIINEAIQNNIFKTFLLHGVTASGKTQVYLELINEVLKKGKSAIYLVPEISLTPQVIRRIKNYFGEQVGVLHSRLSLGERYDEWRAIINQEYKIVVGPRSAVFAPLKNVGLIVVDEEHDHSYKQNETVPYYNARDAAIVRATIENSVVILGSATPSIESYYNAGQSKYTLIELKKRIDDAILPAISFVNLIAEKQEERLHGAFSQTMIDKIEKKIEKKEKVILLQNRRGFATYIICPDCGYTETCKNCSVTLTYHFYKKEYICHYCGFSKKEIEACPTCGSLEIKYRGVGTQRVEDELDQLIPNLRIARMDFDTTTHKGAFSRILSEFAQGNYDVLLGTQMVAKGLDFPNVTMVGVVSAEASLMFPDFRSAERTFQLLTQVAGRSGRSKLKGEVVIQTLNPDNYVLQFVQKHDFAGFYRREMEERQAASYPPFYKIALIEFRGMNLNQVRKNAVELYKLLKYDKKIVTAIGPTPAAIAKLNNRYRYHIILKSKRTLDPAGNYLHKIVKSAQTEFLKKLRSTNVKLSIDIDPLSLI